MWKLTSLFEQSTGEGRRAGWSETWYADGSASVARMALDALEKKRAGMLTSFAVIMGQRIHEIGGRAILSNQRWPGVMQIQQDIPQMAVHCVAGSSSVLNTKPFQLRGVPDVIVDKGDYFPSPTFIAAFENYSQSLQNNSIRFRATDLTKPQVRVLSVAADGTFTLSADISFAVGSTITLLRVKDLSGNNVAGDYYVLSKLNNFSGVFGNWPGNLVGLHGKARLKVFVYPIVSSEMTKTIRITTRKVGRPFALYAGRRQNR